ncbi:unnamed protein product [Soboliphyme baturini]|uniref:Uncharacterized protein n=1 Tax=Soboliphyme baturini TaxID=241478 RepID=A0A183IFF4_9BILA|nr:unnamed protein product [Soboliphyme baturini]
MFCDPPRRNSAFCGSRPCRALRYRSKRGWRRSGIDEIAEIISSSGNSEQKQKLSTGALTPALKLRSHGVQSAVKYHPMGGTNMPIVKQVGSCGQASSGTVYLRANQFYLLITGLLSGRKQRRRVRRPAKASSVKENDKQPLRPIGSETALQRKSSSQDNYSRQDQTVDWSTVLSNECISAMSYRNEDSSSIGLGLGLKHLYRKVVLNQPPSTPADHHQQPPLLGACQPPNAPLALFAPCVVPVLLIRSPSTYEVSTVGLWTHELGGFVRPGIENVVPSEFC